MVDFDKFDKDTLKDTFRLLDDFNEDGFNWRDMRIFSQPADKYIENFFDRRKQRDRTDKLLNSLPSFARAAASSDIDTDFGDDVYSFTKNRFRRSESSYSTTSGYETSSSNETISEEVNDGRRNSRSKTDSRSNYSSRSSTPLKQKYSPSSSASTPLKQKYSPSSSASTPLKQKYSPSSSASSPFQSYSNHGNTSRKERTRHDSDLSKKLENQFMKDERHSVPHELYSDCQYTPEDYERPHSVPVNSSRRSTDTNCTDSDISSRVFPNISVNSSRDSLCSEPLDRFMSRLSSFSSGSSRSSSVVQDGRRSSPNQKQQTEYSNVESNVTNNLPDVLKGDPNGPQIRNIPIAMVDKGNTQSWSERQGRIEDALKWLRSELVGLRAQDKVLLSQLKRCHDTIEDIKKQRSENSDGEDEDGHWEDWEIAEFEKRYAENPDLAEDLFNRKINKDSAVKQDVEASL